MNPPFANVFVVFTSEKSASLETLSQSVQSCDKGNSLDTHADITNSANGQPVARINRARFNDRQMLAGQRTYEVGCAAGIVAIIFAVCMCLDEKKNEKNNQTFSVE